MTIQIHKIEGSRRSACRNNAYAVTDNAGGAEQLLCILPCEEVDGKTVEALRSVFLRRVEGIGTERAAAAAQVLQGQSRQPVPA